MPRTRRIYKAHNLYEIVSRASQGLPLPPTQTTNELVSGVYGRALRSGMVVLCNFVEMNNHHHIHAIPRQIEPFPHFYKDLNKQKTEVVKALLDLSQMNLWEDRATVAHIPRIEDVIARLVYVFCNPAKAGLVDSIDDFPGLSSWKAFKSCEPSVFATISIPVRSYHTAAIPQLPRGNILDEEEDSMLVQQLHNSEEVFEHVLLIRPLAWLQIFGITDSGRIEQIRRRIIKMVYRKEAEFAKNRAFPVIGAANLKRQEYCKPHKPAQKGRKVFVFCSDPKLRKEIIAFVRSVSRQCVRLYQLAKKGVPVVWPDGVFVPWFPPRIKANARDRPL